LRFGQHESRGGLTVRNFRRFVLLLHVGKSVTEVCAILEINANQVYKAKARALEEVRSVLERLGVE
jgi:DNA-directed RNA polymerase specialized sigma24 family protein